MLYNPDINCAAYTREVLQARLQDLEYAKRNGKSRSVKRDAEMERIQQHLGTESPLQRRQRIYPSQMATPAAPGAAHVRALVGPNRCSSASISYGYEGR